MILTYLFFFKLIFLIIFKKWASSLSMIYSNFTKPVLDIVLFSKKLAEMVGFKGPLIVILWYFLSGLFIKVVSPSFGELTART